MTIKALAFHGEWGILSSAGKYAVHFVAGIYDCRKGQEALASCPFALLSESSGWWQENR